MDDQIVNEVRKSREILLERHGGNLKEYIEFLRREEGKNTERIIKTPIIRVCPHTLIGKTMEPSPWRSGHSEISNIML